MNRTVVKAVRAQFVDDVLAGRMLVVREQLRVPTKCLIRLGQLRAPPVARYGVYERVALRVEFE